MTGMAAIAFCAVFTSCSKTENLYDSNAVAEIEKANIIQTYNEAFINCFGQPSANQTWGFGGYNAGTRVENANANEWADPNKAYGGLKVPPALTDAQIAVVKKYFQTVQNPTYQDPHWTNYFIQQVYKGHTDPLEGYSPEAYKAANGGDIIGSDHMDHLAAIDGNFVDHINNFNHGDCSTNGNVLDNGGNANDGPFHSDKIMYMKESTTKSFGYYNSDGSVRRTEYTGLVNYQTIINVLGAEANCLNDGWNRSFMGFDFEQMVGNEVYNMIYTYGSWVAEADRDPNKQYTKDGVEITSATPVTFEFEGKTYNFLSSNGNMYAADKNEKSYVQKNGSYSTTPGTAKFNDRPSDDIIRDLISKGYLPYSDTLKDWVKVGGTADGYFSDWIVTLTEAKTDNTPDPDPNTVRIMAEDLYVTNTSKEGNSDFDFNDVVFDVTFNEDGSASVQILAAGGVYPLTVDGHEVHEALGHPERDAKTHYYKMINTRRNTDADVNGATAEPFTVNKPGENGKDISIKVNRFVVKEDGTVEDHWLDIEARDGVPAAKICVKPSCNYCSEREPISNRYPAFSRWVTDNNPYYIWW